MAASPYDYSRRTIAEILIVICDSGLILRMKDVTELSLRPYEDDEKIVEKLRGIEDGEALYMKTKKNGIQKLTLSNRYNMEYHYSRGSTPEPDQIMKRVIATWLANQEER